MRNIDPELIDAILPQTQCGLCGYGGCMPYAEAIAFQNAPLNLCPPGGVNTLHALSALTQESVSAFIEDMKQTQKPKQKAMIREDECIGCTKCLPACPVDAIIGAAKQMHSIIQTECNGCELCIPACPVDCIDLMTIETPKELPAISREESHHYRKRYENKTKRLQKTNEAKKSIDAARSMTQRQSYIAAMMQRKRKVK